LKKLHRSEERDEEGCLLFGKLKPEVLQLHVHELNHAFIMGSGLPGILLFLGDQPLQLFLSGLYLSSTCYQLNVHKFSFPSNKYKMYSCYAIIIIDSPCELMLLMIKIGHFRSFRK